MSVEGLDVSRRLLEQLHAHTDGAVRLHEADIAAPTQALHGRFDAVVGFFVLHHVHDLTAALAGARRVLKPGGRVVFVEPNAWCPLFYLQIAAVPGMAFRNEGGIVRMRPRPLRRSAERAGLTAVRTRTFGLLPPFAVNRPRGAALEARLEDLPVLRRMRAFRLIVAEAP